MEYETAYIIASLGVIAYTATGYAQAVRREGFRASWRKVGGLTFVRLGRLQVSFCICKR